MFTNEFEHDSTITTVLDEKGTHEDVELIIGDDIVYIRQYNDDTKDGYELIAMSPKMFSDLITALNQAEGFFVTAYKKGNLPPNLES